MRGDIGEIFLLEAWRFEGTEGVFPKSGVAAFWEGIRCAARMGYAHTLRSAQGVKSDAHVVTFDRFKFFRALRSAKSEGLRPSALPW